MEKKRWRKVGRGKQPDREEDEEREAGGEDRSGFASLLRITLFFKLPHKPLGGRTRAN